MSRAVIFANGELSDLDSARALVRADDLIIAADGGLRHCRALGLTPHTLIGDFDSTAPADSAAFETAGTRLVRYPARKDQTDLELALEWAITHGADDIVILGALGGRWDQTLANLLLPALPAWNSARIRIVDGRQQISLVRGPGTISLIGSPGDTVSLIPIGGDAQGITTTGLDYALTNGRLHFGSTLGISNALIAGEASVSLHAGLLVCAVIQSSQTSKAQTSEV